MTCQVASSVHNFKHVVTLKLNKLLNDVYITCDETNRILQIFKTLFFRIVKKY